MRDGTLLRLHAEPLPPQLRRLASHVHQRLTHRVGGARLMAEPTAAPQLDALTPREALDALYKLKSVLSS